MAYEHDVNTGSIWPPNEKAPKDVFMSGDINIEGTVYWISLWKKKSADQQHIRVTIKPKEQRRSEGFDNLDDDFDSF